jgi:hypothetical protein
MHLPLTLTVTNSRTTLRAPSFGLEICQYWPYSLISYPDMQEDMDWPRSTSNFGWQMGSWTKKPLLLDILLTTTGQMNCIEV